MVTFDSAPTTVTGPGAVSVTGGLATSFNTVSGFGLNAMSSGNPGVMSFAAPGLLNAQGLTFVHASTSPNTTGYTVLMDIYYTAIPDYVSLLQMDNTADGDLFGRSTGAIGISGIYEGTGLTTNAWHRVAMTINGTQNEMRIYIDGVLANGSVAPSAPARYNLASSSFLMFADEDGETAAGYIAQAAFEDRVYTADEIRLLGPAGSPAIPEPSGVLLVSGALALGLVRRRPRVA